MLFSGHHHHLLVCDVQCGKSVQQIMDGQANDGWPSKRWKIQFQVSHASNYSNLFQVFLTKNGFRFFSCFLFFVSKKQLCFIHILKENCNNVQMHGLFVPQLRKFENTYHFQLFALQSVLFLFQFIVNGAQVMIKK